MYAMWVTSVVAILVMDLRTGALKAEAILQPRRCHQCSATNTTSCDEATGWLTATCPPARPYCATTAISPDYTSSLGCAAASENPCSLVHSPTQTFELTCICTGQLCNAPFSTQLRNDLLNSSNLSKLFDHFNSSAYIYKLVTHTVNSSEILLNKSEIPRSEALKATVASEDDEDESEGSGSYEDSKTQLQGHGSAPAAPSSFLPAESKAIKHVISNVLLPLLLVILFYILR